MSVPSTMDAVVLDGFGGAEALRDRLVPVPDVGSDVTHFRVHYLARRR